MSYDGLITEVKLAAPPISSFDYTHIKGQREFRTMFENSMVYALVQRSILVLRNISLSEDRSLMYFEIHQLMNPEVLYCTFNIFESINQKFNIEEAEIEFFQSFIRPELSKDVDGIIFHEFEGRRNLLWLSPDNFINYFSNNIITKSSIRGDVKLFTKFYVHYVGKATGQHILDRLESHGKFKDAVIINQAYQRSVPVAFEIFILFFHITSKIQLRIHGSETIDKPEIEENSFAFNHPTDVTVSLDIEKAFVHCLNPEMNDPEKSFNNYPKSKDGLFPFKFNRYSYQILEDITLKCRKAEITCSTNKNLCDIIGVDNNETASIIKLSEE